jgi:hypothetical protein
MFRFALPYILLMLLSAPASAEPALLTSDALRQTFAGSSVHVDTPLGLILKVDYLHDGTLSGDAGNLAFYMGSAKDNGRWWVENGKICHIWNIWFDRERSCLQIRGSGQRVAWRRDDGEQGTATIISRPVFVQAQAAPAPMRPAPPVQRADTQPQPAKPIASLKPPAAQAKVKTATAATKNGNAPKPKKTAQAPTQKTEPRTILPPEPTFRVVGVPDYDVLNMRSGPSADDALVGTISPNGRGIRLTGRCRLEWCVFTHKGIQGWINRYYLSIETPYASARN